jgi:ABC-2 type transport system ATP-binding protein
VIEIKDLQKVIDGRTVLEVSKLVIEAGEIAALVGAVDSGLEAAFELLTGQAQPSAGSVRVSEIDPFSQRDALGKQVGVLFSEDNLYMRQTALANLKFYCRINRLPQSRASEALNQVGLADQARTVAGELPASLARRLSFGRAILHQPQVLLLFKPFENCDEASISLLSKLIEDQAECGTSVLILAHDERELAPICQMIYRLEQGHIVKAYNPAEVEQLAMPFMIPARLEGRVALVDPAEILFIYAQDDRAYLQLKGESIPTQFSLTELEKRLARSGFFRTHRSYLVNLQHVKEIIPYTRDSFSLRLKDKDNSEIPLSKAAARELRELLGY